MKENLYRIKPLNWVKSDDFDPEAGKGEANASILEFGLYQIFIWEADNVSLCISMADLYEMGNSEVEFNNFEDAKSYAEKHWAEYFSQFLEEVKHPVEKDDWDRQMEADAEAGKLDFLINGG